MHMSQEKRATSHYIVPLVSLHSTPPNPASGTPCFKSVALAGDGKLVELFILHRTHRSKIPSGELVNFNAGDSKS